MFETNYQKLNDETFVIQKKNAFTKKMITYFVSSSQNEALFFSEIEIIPTHVAFEMMLIRCSITSNQETKCQ